MHYLEAWAAEDLNRNWNSSEIKTSTKKYIVYIVLVLISRHCCFISSPLFAVGISLPFFE